MDSAGLFIKTAVIALISFQAMLLIVRGRRIPAVGPALGFIYCLICYMICTMTGPVRPMPLWKYPVAVGCMGVPFFFWLLSRALFDDHFRPRAVHWLIFAGVQVLSFAKALKIPAALFIAAESNALLREILRPFPQIISLVFVIHALGLAYTGIKADLLEDRRKLRIIFIIAVGVYTVIVLLFEVMLKGRAVPGGLELVHAVIFLLLTVTCMLRMNTLEQGIFFAKPAPAKSPPEPDKVLDEKLSKLLVEDGAFRNEGLTVRSLAEDLGLPEYKLRRHINHALGYRNFNDFLNHYRVREAQRMLRDPEHRDLAILRMAMDLGYGSLAPFNRAFRRIAGMTPTEYRAGKEIAPTPAENDKS